jgi:hypothetical protein
LRPCTINDAIHTDYTKWADYSIPKPNTYRGHLDHATDYYTTDYYTSDYYTVTYD